jgi:tRNA(Ile)-lysidine synthase
MLAKVRDTIERHGMLSGKETVVVCVSGGVDSAVLLHVLSKLTDEYSLKLVVAHLNHNLRAKESSRDLNFVRTLAKGLGLKFAGKTLRAGELKKAGRSVQEAAREKRYAFFEETAVKFGATKIALGHTEDDQAETVLMRLLKGSSLTGLTGIPAVRGRFIRPLIEVSRAEIEDYAQKAGIKHVLDSSNLKDKYLRNDIRLNLIPYLMKNYNPNIVETLARTASVLRADDDYLEQVARTVAPSLVLEERKGGVVLERGKLAALHEALSSRVFLFAAELLGKRAEISSTHIKSFIKIIKGEKPNATADLPGVRIAREYGRVIVSLPEDRKPVFFKATLKVPGSTVVRGAGAVFKATLLKKGPSSLAGGEKTAYFDLDEIEGPVTIRQIAPGDKMAPFGMKGTKKLKDIFIEKKVPRPLRAKVPVLSTGRGILWAAGVRRSELCKVKKGTVRVLKLEFREVKGRAV